jgi:hypothetical protein
MKVKGTMVIKYSLTELESLDPVFVTLEDPAPGKGKITIECYGKAWTAYFGAIGDQAIHSFINSCDTGYLANKLSDISPRVTDFDAISEKLGFCVDRDSLWASSADMSTAYGSDWYMDLPQTPNPDYEYLERIIKVVKEFVSQMEIIEA